MAATYKSQQHGEPLYEKLRKQLIEQIEREHLNILPNEKSLMNCYGVSRNTLRRAVLELTKENIVRPIQGIGTLVHPDSGVVAGSSILAICDRSIYGYQQEIFNELFFNMSSSNLSVNLLMIDKEHVNIPLVEQRIKHCDAIILDLYCSFSPSLRELAAKSGKKRICLRWNATPHGLSSVETDISEGAYLLMKLLLEQGHRKIICAGTSKEDSQRQEGIEKACAEFGVGLPEYFKKPYEDYEDIRKMGWDIAEEVLKKVPGFTAVFANNDEIALGFEEKLLSVGMRIPEDVSITGFDNLIASRTFPVPLTTCSGNTMEMIQEAIAYLFSTRRPDELFYKKFRPEIIIRESTGPVKSSGA